MHGSQPSWLSRVAPSPMGKLLFSVGGTELRNFTEIRKGRHRIYLKRLCIFAAISTLRCLQCTIAAEKDPRLFNHAPAEFVIVMTNWRSSLVVVFRVACFPRDPTSNMLGRQTVLAQMPTNIHTATIGESRNVQPCAKAVVG